MRRQTSEASWLIAQICLLHSLLFFFVKWQLGTQIYFLFLCYNISEENISWVFFLMMYAD